MKRPASVSGATVRLLSRTHRTVALAHEGCHRLGLATDPAAWKRLGGWINSRQPATATVALANRLDREALYLLSTSGATNGGIGLPDDGRHATAVESSHALEVQGPGVEPLILQRVTHDPVLGDMDWSGGDGRGPGEWRPIEWRPGHILVLHGKGARVEQRAESALDRMAVDEAALRRALRGSGVRVAKRIRLAPTRVEIVLGRSTSAALALIHDPAAAATLAGALRSLWHSPADLARDIRPDESVRRAREVAHWLEGLAPSLARPTRQCIERITGLQARLAGSRLVPTLGRVSAIGPRIDAGGRLLLTDLSELAMAVPERDLAQLLGALARAPAEDRAAGAAAVSAALQPNDSTRIAIDPERLEVQRLVRALQRARLHCLRPREAALDDAVAVLTHALGP